MVFNIKTFPKKNKKQWNGWGQLGLLISFFLTKYLRSYLCINKIFKKLLQWTGHVPSGDGLNWRPSTLTLTTISMTISIEPIIISTTNVYQSHCFPFTIYPIISPISSQTFELTGKSPQRNSPHQQPQYSTDTSKQDIQSNSLLEGS